MQYEQLAHHEWETVRTLKLQNTYCSEQGCKKIVEATLDQIEKRERDFEYIIKCQPKYRNVVDGRYCGNNVTATRLQVIEGRCVNVTYCPACIDLPDEKSCLKCTRGFKPGCKVRFLCYMCFSNNKREHELV